MSDDIYRILAPSEYKALLAAIPKIDKRLLVETMMNTGMRYQELVDFGDNPQWFKPKDRCIFIPAEYIKQFRIRPSRTWRGRTVHLTPQFSEKLELYLASNELKFPGRSNMAKDLQRWWGVSRPFTGATPYTTEEITKLVRSGWSPMPKTFRKTWETWLIFAGYDSLKVAVSQGHTQTVQIAHYQNLIGSLKNEAEAVKELTRGWMT